MARLLVFRGETLDREVEVGRETFRIGRGEQNDLILEDRGKAVSRNHAEIRYENGRYVLADLDSQNGIWIAGSRVPSVVLEPKVVASLGPYRLMLEVEPPTDAGFAIPDSGAIETGDYAELAKTQVRPVEPVVRATPTPPAPKTTPVPQAPPPPVAAKPAATKAPVKGPAAAKGQPPAMTKWLVIGGAAVLVIVLAVVVMRFARTPAPANPNAVQLVGMITDARRLIEQGDCAGALARAIEPALSIDPANADAQALKAQATACTPPPTTTVPPVAPAMAPEEVAAHLQAATEALGRKECEPAMAEITKVLDVEASNEQALDLKAKAEGCSAPPVRPTREVTAPPKVVVVPVPPERGGLELNAGESDKDYQARIKAMRTRYDEAVAALAKESSPRVIALLDGIAREAGPKYLEVTQKLLEARKTLAAQLVNEGRELDARNEYDQAIGRFLRAATLDRDVKVDEDVKRVQEKKLQAGLKACDEAKNAFAFNRGQLALQYYQQVIKLLPENHPCFATARERIATLSR